MSQEYNAVPKKQRRTRSPRNRPTLVTSTTSISANEDHLAEPAETVESAQSAESAESIATIAEPTVPAAPTQRRSSLLPNFFSKVDKGDQDDTTGGANVIQARMARARKGVVVGEKTAVKNEGTREVTKATTSPTPAKATPNRPPGLFKTRHIAGMAIYLLAAQFILPYERIFAINTGIEKQLTNFPFFGFNASITTSFLLNIITLIVLLYLLVHFDLLPSGKKIAQTQPGKTGSGQNANRTDVEKPAPKTVREGVKGQNDDLYMAYRNSQRREKKR